MSTKGPIEPRTCGVCGQVYPTVFGAKACAESGFPKIPAWKPGQRLRLAAEVYARRFSGKPNNWPASQNTFVLAGPLFDVKRTMHCAIKFDPARQAHRYEACVRWMGAIGDIKVNRLVWVWADDLEPDTEITPAPQPAGDDPH